MTFQSFTSDDKEGLRFRFHGTALTKDICFVEVVILLMQGLALFRGMLVEHKHPHG